MRKLVAFQITGETYIEGDILSAWTKTVGIDTLTFDNCDLDGCDPFKIIITGQSIPDRYVDISTIENWDMFAIDYANDYAVVRFAIQDIVNEKNWSGLTNTEKDIAIKYFSYQNPTDAVVYLMTVSGMTQSEAQKYLIESWHIHHLKNTEAYQQRWQYAKYIVLLYLNRTDATDLFKTVKNLVDLYYDVGIIGKDFGESEDGLDDYINSKNGFLNQGLEENNYTLLQGDWASFRNDLTNVIVHGDYHIYKNYN